MVKLTHFQKEEPQLQLKDCSRLCPTQEGSQKVARVSQSILSPSERIDEDPWKSPSPSKVHGAKRPGSVRNKEERRFSW